MARKFRQQYGHAYEIDAQRQSLACDRDSDISIVDFAAFSFEAYELLGARLSLSDSDGRWDVSLIGRNLKDEEYWTSSTTDDLGSYASMRGLPMSYAIEATFRW